MSEYQLTAAAEPCSVIRASDKACIPPDMANHDYNGDQLNPGYLQWVEDGGVADPYVPPPVPIDPELDSVGTGKTAAEILGVT